MGGEDVLNMKFCLPQTLHVNSASNSVLKYCICEETYVEGSVHLSEMSS